MDAATYGYNPLSTLSSTLLNTPVSFQNMFTPSGQIGTDFNSQVYNDFDLAFGIASQANYPEPPSGPESPSYWHSHDEAHFHDDTTGDESVEFQATSSSKPRTMETRKRKPGSRKSVQPQEQILKRRVQNRAAQRSFRERQKEYVHDLEHQVEQLKDEISKLHESYQELLKVVSVGQRIPQWSADLSPAMTEELDFNEADGLEPVKMENMWPVESSRDYQGPLYA
jgi:hypothetical protein